MTGDRLGELLDEAVGPPAQLDVQHLGHRLTRRRRQRVALRRGLLIVAVILAAVPAGRALDQLQPQVRFAPVAGMAPFDPAVQVADGVPTLDEGALALEPTRLPDGAVRCHGPSTTGVLTVTTYCLADGGAVELARGPHSALPEMGTSIAVADRTGYLEGAVLTVSDADSMDDTHHRLDSRGHLTAAEMATVLASIPAVGSDSP